MTSWSSWMLLHLPLEDAAHMCSIWFRSGDILGHSITLTFSSKAVVILAVCLGWLLCWIHVSLNELQLPCTSSSHAAPDHDATTTMLDCRQGTIFLVLITRASPHMLDTIWVKQVYLRLIRPQDMVSVIHALDQVVLSKLFAGFLWSSFRRGFLLGRRPCKPTCCSVWRMVWAPKSWPSTSATFKAMLAAAHAVCFLKPASESEAQHKDSTSKIDPCEACSEWNPSWKTSVWPWPLYCNSVSGCYRTAYSLGHLCGEQQF